MSQQLENHIDQYNPQQNQTYQHHNNKHYLINHANKIKCICQLCSCGKHHCPRPKIKGDFSTSYKQHFQPLPLPTSPPKNNFNYQTRHYAPDSLVTNYKQNYQPIQIPEPKSQSRLGNIGAQILRPQATFVGTTSYKDQYQPFKIQPLQPPSEQSLQMIANSRLRQHVKFEGQSSYKSQYTNPGNLKAYRYPPQISNNPGAFLGSSSYKDSYQPHQIQKSNTIVNYRSIPQVKFQANTTYGQHYKPVSSIPYQKHECIVQKLNLPQNASNGHVYFDQQKGQFV